VPSDLEADLLAQLTKPTTAPPAAPELNLKVGPWSLERWRFNDEVTVIGTDAALLPQQLGHLSDTDTSPLTIALATGNRVTRQKDGRLQDISAVSEETFGKLATALEAARRA
jgi:hypothetical protein